MIGSLLLVVSTLAAAPAAKVSSAPAHTIVAGFERFYAPTAATGPLLKNAADGGRLLLGELNCTSCHRADDRLRDALLPKQAPRLTKVADRVRPEWIREYLANPQSTKPGTSMPDALAGLAPEEKARRVEALTHFLASAGDGRLFDTYVDQSAVKRGEQTFHEKGCAACHGSRKTGAKPISFAVPLGDPAKKYTVETLSTFLRDPHAVRPSGRMPSLMLPEQEADDVAMYLLRDVVAEPNLNYSVYYGSWEGLPNFDAMKPEAQGRVAGFDLDVAKRDDNYGIRFEGYLHVEKEADFRFRTNSDDGSRLYVDGQLSVDNDGIHPPSQKEARARLKPGPHLVRVDFFEAGGGAELSAQIQLPDSKTFRGLASFLTPTPAGPSDSKPSFKIDTALVAEGRKLFASSGCASCHELKEDDKRIASTTAAAPNLDKLAVDKPAGCLDDDAKPNAPGFALSPAQRTSLTAALAEVRDGGKSQPASAVDAARLHQSLAAFNCYGCHQRAGLGGVDPNKTIDFDDDGFPDLDPTSELLSPLFSGTTPEMGDEGRLPPRLDGVGAKLTEGYFKQVLERGSKDRPYVKTVMPNFGGGNVGRLAAMFQSLDPPIADQLAELHEPPLRSKADGRQLVGTKGFGCVKCHQFNKEKAEGIQGIDMTIITRRVRPEWFVKYVTNPQSLRPGTRMPTIFPDGKTPLTEIESGDPAKQVAAMWAFLLDGDKAAVPIGVGGQPIELVADKEAIIYRNFIAGAGSRAIGVGYPERVSLAFDAENLRPAIIWRGAFIDAARHWVGRGVGFQGPLGDEILPMPQGVTFAELKSPADAWPAQGAIELGLHFRGYRLGENRRPTFLYDLPDGTHVAETYRPMTGQVRPNLERKLVLTGGKAGVGELYFRAAAGKQIKPLADDWFEIDGLWRVRVGGGDKPQIRSAGEGQELVVRVGRDGVELIEELAW